MSKYKRKAGGTQKAKNPFYNEHITMTMPMEFGRNKNQLKKLEAL